MKKGHSVERSAEYLIAAYPSHVKKGVLYRLRGLSEVKPNRRMKRDHLETSASEYEAGQTDMQSLFSEREEDVQNENKYARQSQSQKYVKIKNKKKAHDAHSDALRNPLQESNRQESQDEADGPSPPKAEEEATQKIPGCTNDETLVKEMEEAEAIAAAIAEAEAETRAEAEADARALAEARAEAQELAEEKARAEAEAQELAEEMARAEAEDHDSEEVPETSSATNNTEGAQEEPPNTQNTNVTPAAKPHGAQRVIYNMYNSWFQTYITGAVLLPEIFSPQIEKTNGWPQKCGRSPNKEKAGHGYGGFEPVDSP